MRNTLEHSIYAAKMAGEIIMSFYKTKFSVKEKILTYHLNIEINSQPLKNGMIEVNT